MTNTDHAAKLAEADELNAVIEPGLGWKLSDAARDKIMEIDRENVRNASDLHSIILASLHTPATPSPDPVREGLVEALRECAHEIEATMRPGDSDALLERVTTALTRAGVK